MPVGAHMAVLSCSSRATPVDFTRVAAATHCAVAHGPPALGRRASSPTPCRSAVCPIAGLAADLHPGQRRRRLGLPAVQAQHGRTGVEDVAGHRYITSSAPLLTDTDGAAELDGRALAVVELDPRGGHRDLGARRRLQRDPALAGRRRSG